ncbi:hypothetical protein NDU88_001002 [Pleurodeles waltl]|uniref:Uncharacterized protein n=1 Tax=Pleurodeles waltl TaxID=8319 RepID=A0AAV7P4H5_PLEWA|nr:hypothetical protein NDU88_001002 [Pleurodeles waltl]
MSIRSYSQRGAPPARSSRKLRPTSEHPQPGVPANCGQPASTHSQEFPQTAANQRADTARSSRKLRPTSEHPQPGVPANCGQPASTHNQEFPQTAANQRAPTARSSRKLRPTMEQSCGKPKEPGVPAASSTDGAPIVRSSHGYYRPESIHSQEHP